MLALLAVVQWIALSLAFIEYHAYNIDLRPCYLTFLLTNNWL